MMHQFFWNVWSVVASLAGFLLLYALIRKVWVTLKDLNDFNDHLSKHNEYSKRTLEAFEARDYESCKFFMMKTKEEDDRYKKSLQEYGNK